MNASAIDRNTKAKENGNFCEEYARQQFPGLEWVGSTFDAVLNGVPIDIKGCEAWYSRHDLPNADRRAGRVTFENEQDTLLKKLKGAYFIVVHIGELVTDSFFVPAEKVPLVRQASWTTMHRLAEAC